MEALRLGGRGLSDIHDRRRLILLCALLPTMLTMSLLPRPALASPPQSCADVGDRHVQATNGTQTGNHQAIRSTVMFWGTNDQCSRVSSITVVNANGFVEWGWLLGWLFGQDVPFGSCGQTSTYHQEPVRFAFWRPINGGLHCQPEGEVVGGFDYGISLRDADSDTVWQYLFEATSLGSMDVNFDRGTLRTNAERIPGDIGRAHFNNLKFQIAGNATWFDFVDLDPGLDDDGVYNCIMVSNTNQKVEAQPTTCVN
jgi:hypothetical protein